MMRRTSFGFIVATGLIMLARPGASGEPMPGVVQASGMARQGVPAGATSRPAERLGPESSKEKPNGPRLVVSPWASSPWASDRRSSSIVTASAPSSNPASPDPSLPADRLSDQQRWMRDVELPARLRQIDSQITLAEKRLESNQQRRERLAGYNIYASPETAGFSPTDIWPGVETYNPVTIAGPVRSFSPRSSFSHVLAALQRQTDAAETELDALRRQRDELSAAVNDPSQLEAADGFREPSGRGERMAASEAGLRLAEFRRQSYEARLQQVEELARLTYLGGYVDLREKLKLGQLREELRIQDLRYFQRLVRDFDNNRGIRTAVPSRIAVTP